MTVESAHSLAITNHTHFGISVDQGIVNVKDHQLGVGKFLGSHTVPRTRSKKLGAGAPLTCP